MAPYNPEVKPTNDPKYGNFQPITIPDSIKPRGVETNTIMPEGPKQGDRSGEYLGQAKSYGYQAEAAGTQGFGKLFENLTATMDFAAKGGVALVKKDIEDRVYDVANRERLAYTDALEKIKSGVGVKNILDANASMDDGAETPDEVANLPGTLEGLTSARDSGKISGTYYASRLLAEAKDLRARYPGFRQEIDEQFAKVTGMNPANAYINNLVRDINHAAASNASQKTKTLTYIRNNYMGHELGQKTYQEYGAGLIDDNEVNRRFAPYERMKFEINQRNLKASDNTLTREENARHAKANIDYSVGATVATATDSLLAQIGINSEADVSRIDALTKSGAISPKQWNDWGTKLETSIKVLRAQLISDADKYGYTFKVGGKEKVVAQVEAGLSPLKEMAQLVFAKDSGTLYKASREAKAIGDQDTLDVLNDSIVGPFHRQLQVQRNTGGDQWVSKVNLNAIADGIQEKYKTYNDRWKGALATQQSKLPGGEFVTLNHFVDEVKRKGIADPKLNNSVINEITKIADPDTPTEIKKNYSRAAFSPGNYEFISKLTDPKGNPSVNSQNAVFQRFTSEAMTKEMFKLGQDDPKLWNDYVNWTKHTLTNNLINREINDLSEIRNPAIQVGWDTENKRFKVDYVGGYESSRGRPGLTQGGVSAAGRRETDTEYALVERSVNRMNSNLSNFKRVADASGENVDQFVLGAIAQSNPEALKNVTSIPYQILHNIGIANLKNNNKGIGSK